MVVTEGDLGQRVNRDVLSPHSIIVQEEYVSPGGMSGAVAHWGVRRSNSAMVREVEDEAQILDIPAQVIGNSGFDEIFRMSRFQDDREIDHDAHEVALRLARQAIEGRGWEPSDVDYLDFGSSVGNGEMADRIKEDLGLVNANTSQAFLACNSAGFLLNRRLSDQDSQGKNVLLLASDPITRLIRDSRTSDFASRQLFSNGGASLAYQPGIDLRRLTGYSLERSDSRGITAVAPYELMMDGWRGDGEHTIFESEGTAMVFMSPPPEGKVFDMRGKNTAVVFITMAADSIARTYQNYKDLFPDREPDFAVGHHPSLPVFNGLSNRLSSNYGINLPFQWVVADGNSSGATSLIAWNRSMSNYQSGQHGIFASYGAGASANCFAVEIL